jgi:NAD(P)-dependent dehydrogenase (short-subunit alcohol dehydrogenase family)
MGRALARQMADRGDHVVLLGRDPQELERSVADLDSRGKAGLRAGMAACDLERPESFAPALAHARQHLQGLDVVVVTAAAFATQDQLEQDLELTARLLATNFTNTILFCEHARKLLLDEGGGTLCVFSSVAGERGRTPVVLYGASKAGLTRYLEGLDHRFSRRGLRIVCVKPGFVTTSMTRGLRPPPFAGTAEGVATQVLRAIDRGDPVVYAPLPWALVMAVVRRVPRFVMRRVAF